MDTTKKGDELEDKIYELFRDDILNDRFWAKKELCKIYQKKGYFSADRKKDIIFDVAIEIYLPGQSTYSSLILIECKNYSKKRVPVGDIESFLMKAHQVSGGNIKAIVASNNAFQEGTFNFAESKNIGLLRYFDRTNHDWVLTRSPSSLISSNYALNEWSIARNGLHSESHSSKYFDFYGYVDKNYTNSLRIFFSSLVKKNQSEEYLKSLVQVESTRTNDPWIVKYLELEEIESQCESLLNSIAYDGGIVPLDELCLYLKEKHDLNVIHTDSLQKDVLGQITFSPLEIQINSNHENESRKRFTLAHEIGHLILGHSAYMTSEKCHQSSIDLDEPEDIGIRDVMRMEWQANQFASCLLLPKSKVAPDFISLVSGMGIINRGYGVLYVDDQPCNLDAYFKISNVLINKYKVSRSVVKIRLSKLGYLNKTSGTGTP